MLYMWLQDEDDSLLVLAIELRLFLYIHEEGADTCKSCYFGLGLCVSFLLGSYLNLSCNVLSGECFVNIHGL